jgi:two-component system, chemotaxis family, CheB/CheR fusion protein
MASNESTEDSQPAIDRVEADDICTIVGVGASAGGLEAFTELLKHLPIDTGMAFVLIQHLAPTHPSLLTPLLAKVTAMPVVEIEDGMSVRSDRVYVIPPNCDLVLVGNRLQLSMREKIHGKYLPVDRFLESLATQRQHRSIAVVLSGTDSDGAIGIAAVKAAGGITFAQDIASSKFEGMPDRAIATGHVDFVLPPGSIATEIAKIAQHSYVARLPPVLPEIEASSVDEASVLATIFTLLNRHKGVDFTGYKPATLKRRILRRMALHNFERWDDYSQYLGTHPIELDALERDLLINVTSFFRDPVTFDRLTTTVLPTILARKSLGVAVRIWVAGCSTGEEAYSIGICLLEYLAERDLQLPIQIFATDISESAIDRARKGIYKPEMMAGISDERLHRFFVEVDGGYQISKAVRELCVFARQNLIADPPFSQLDLISCRNVLIYLGSELQKRLIPIFHYALKPQSFLMLGTSESIGEFTDLFASLDKKSKIYDRKSAPRSPYLRFNSSDRALAKVKPMMPIDDDNRTDLDLNQAADRLVLDRYAPVGVTIDADMNIVQFRGQTGNYFEPAAGKPSFNLFKMVKPELVVELRAAVHQAKQQQEIVRQEGLRLSTATGVKTIDLEVIPFQVGALDRPYLLVLFQESAISISDAPSQLATPRAKKGKQTLIEQEQARLQQELATTHEYLQAIIEEQESTNQAFQVANEEILSSNEELQSTNEELETSQEELQATNEELHTINEELNSRNTELGQLNNDLQNLLSSINIPILMLDGELRIRRFTTLAQKMFNLIPTDLGRPFSDIQPNIIIPDLGASIVKTIETLTTTEEEIQDRTGAWYSLRIRPYRTIDNRIDGVTIGLIDIDTLKRSATRIEAARDYANAIVETVRQPLLVLNPDLRVIRANQSFYETFQLTPAQTEQQSIFEVKNRLWNLPDLRSLLGKLLAHDTEFQDFEATPLNPDSDRMLLFNAWKIRDELHEHSILLAIEDITERRRAETLIRDSLTEKEVLLREIHHRVKNNLQIVSSLLSLQSNRVADPQTVEILQDSQNRVRSMALIHQSLYQSSNLANLNFAEYIQILVNNLFTSYSVDRAAVALHVDVEPGIAIDVDRAVLCGLIVNELVTNAFKHGFVGNLPGEIVIDLTTSDDNILTISIANNGQELPSDFDVHKVQSMGLNLVISLIKQLRGDLKVETGTMTIFKLIFPLFPLSS